MGYLWMISLLLSLSQIAGAQKIKFICGGEERNFILHLPKSFSEKAPVTYPVILCLHGKGSNGREMKMYTGLNKTGDKMNSIIAYPTTADEQWPYADTVAIRKETAYLQAIIQYLTSYYRADPERIYMTGMSSGGIFTFTFASQYPTALKGIAVVSGNITLAAKKNIEKNALILPPLLLIHGTGDKLLYHGREGMCMSAEDSFTTYLSACTDPAPIIEKLPDTKPKDKCTVEKINYNCQEKLIYYRITNGGHHWPGANFNAALFTSLRLGHFCRDFKANDAIRDFIFGLEGR